MIRFFMHYGLHLLAPAFFALFFRKGRRLKAYLIMLATMLVDLDHFLAEPVFHPYRLSVGFHPLHSYPAIAVYLLLCFLPYERLKWPWWLRPVGIGLTFHMITDLQDFFLWVPH